MHVSGLKTVQGVQRYGDAKWDVWLAKGWAVHENSHIWFWPTLNMPPFCVGPLLRPGHTALYVIDLTSPSHHL
jgi:hypothetical protein